jgi:hypothetical protein
MSRRMFAVDTAGFRSQVGRFANALGLKWRDVFRVEMALWGEDLAKRTGFVPRGSLRSSGSGASPTLARAITNDLMSTFRVVPGEVKRGRKRRIEIESHYRSARDPRTGRASPRRVDGVRPVISNKEMMSLARRIFRHAGTVRAGWIPMIRKFRGKMPQAWITRNASRASGDARDMSERGLGRKYMEGTNKVRWASRMCPPNLLAFTARVRDRHMQHLLRLETNKGIEAFNRIRSARMAA